MTQPIDVFREEAREHLASLEQALLELEIHPQDEVFINQSFRAMHTIKGSGGMFGFNDLSSFTHHLESAFEAVRRGQLEIGPEFVSLMLDAKDHIEDLLHNPITSIEQQVHSQLLIRRLNEITPTDSFVEAAGSGLETEAKSELPNVFRIRFTPSWNTFTEGFDVVPILRELHACGECHITTLHKNLPTIYEMDPEKCYLSWDLTLVSQNALNSIRDTFIFVADEWKVEIEVADLSDQSLESDRLGELLIGRGLISPEQLKAVLAKNREVGVLLREQGLVTDDDVQAALNEQSLIRRTKETRGNSVVESVVKVPASRLDALMNLVGELVIVQARMNQIAHRRNDEDVIAVAEELDRLTTEMRDHTFSIRMLPIGTTFGRFRRLVRDLSSELHKKIILETQGAETELDKMVIDKLADPLVHLIRNSIDHGIELPEQREAAGKVAEGKVLLSAEHLDSKVVIRIADDGRGLDTEAIYRKALERGLVNANSKLSEEDIHQLIFEPGFSTAKVVSDISGRGVGLDVVRRSIHELGGKVTISSAAGKGTTFSIQLPMTLAIIEGLMVKVAGEHYVLPLGAVEECVEMLQGNDSRDHRRRLVQVRGTLIPYLHLREWFGAEGKSPNIEQVVITRMGEERFGFCVDEVIGQHQTVVKRLGKLYEGVTGFSGATILGDGNVALILDPTALMSAAEGNFSSSLLETQEH